MTGSSSFFPVSVRGIAGTTSTESGMWRGESDARSAAAMRARSSSSTIASAAGTTNRISSPAPPSASSRCTTRLSAISGKVSTTV